MKNDKGPSGFLDTARLRDRAKDLPNRTVLEPHCAGPVQSRIYTEQSHHSRRVDRCGCGGGGGQRSAPGSRGPGPGRRGLDLVDGAMARLTGKQSKFGAVLDSTFDRLGEAAALFGLLALYSGLGNTPYVLLVFAAMFGSVLVSYIKARAEGEGIDCNVGLLSRGERVVLLGLGLLINQVPAVLVILTFFSYVTAAQRLWRVKKATEETTQDS